ncbi:glycosyltransferase family 4 protein [Tenacibaculum retecalamus]|uniref:glycosyltransferase family 4 protein n=1 Tax=Tenacibaculum retecalamus TaxID=3018315 RepID=UPI0023D96A80|nr:glycosyltransferase family 4 protein [Tenacibaculum retecalamus]WBX70727.1 glycosyltransferase family 4 protein [Tenacibaculum retecalamus]
MNKPKLVRITTVPMSLDKLIEGQMAFMKKYFKVTAISSGREELKKIGKKEDVDTFYIKLTRKITPFKDLKATYFLYKFLKKEKPQIVHTHTPKAGIVGMLASYLARVPNRLHTVAGLPLLEARGGKRKVLNFVEKLTYKCATKVYPNSYGLQEIILKNKFTITNKLKVIANGSSNGINTTHFNPSLFLKEDNAKLKKQLGIKKDDFVFIFVGRIVGDKGINELVEAFNKLSKEKESVKLLLVEPFEDELDPLKSSTRGAINNNKQIISVGFMNDVRPFFAIANALVFPSYREGFPNVVMQAGAMGLPSIVSNINGCNEIIEENKNGFIIPVKNKEAVYDAMKKIVLNTNMKENARTMISERYEQKVVWEALLTEYKLL